MIVQLHHNINPDTKTAVLNKIKSIGYKTNEVITQMGSYLVCIGSNEFDPRIIGHLDGVADIHRVSDKYKLVSRKWKVKSSRVDLGDDILIKRGRMNIIAGPCSIESVEHAEQTMNHLIANDIHILRSMVFKPRSSPYAFRGIGIEGLREISAIAKEKGIKLISEVMQVSQIEQMVDYVDIFQVGARNTQNFNLLDSLGEVNKPVLLKRGISGSIDELLHSAEYIFSNGNEKIILCERGIRTFETAYRNTFDLNAIPILKEKSHLPVVADPSHSIGIRQHVATMALSSVMAGADGILMEVHEKPEKAFSDGQQTLSFPEAEKTYKAIRETFELRERLKN